MPKMYEESGRVFMHYGDGSYKFIFAGGYDVPCKNKSEFVKFARYYLDEPTVNRIIRKIG